MKQRRWRRKCRKSAHNSLMTLSQQNMGQSSTFFVISLYLYQKNRFGSAARAVPSAIRSSSTVAWRAISNSRRMFWLSRKKKVNSQPMADVASRIIWRDAVQTSNSLENKPWPDAFLVPPRFELRNSSHHSIISISKGCARVDGCLQRLPQCYRQSDAYPLQQFSPDNRRFRNSIVFPGTFPFERDDAQSRSVLGYRVFKLCLNFGLSTTKAQHF